MIRILAPFNIELYCVSVSEKKPTDTANALMENLKSYLGNVNPKLKVSCSFLEGKDVVQTFLDFVKTNQINLVALTSIKRSLIYKLLNPVAFVSGLAIKKVVFTYDFFYLIKNRIIQFPYYGIRW